MATSYQKRFYYTFKDITNAAFTVEIWKLATEGTVTATLVKAAENPFIVTLPAIGDKFEPVRGSGCQINLLSETNMQFLELYTADMFGFMIKAYKGATLIWTGYLDSELYTEPFNELVNYPVSFSGSDGFALLERMNYLDAVGAKYTGLDTQFNILKNIITKLGLPFQYIYIYLSTVITGVSNAAGQTILNITYVDNSNFYDEDGVALNLRQVLESILRPYGVFITQNNGNLYITDVQAVASATLTSTLYYNISNFAYIGTSNIAANIGDLSTIKFASSDQNLNIVAGVNKEVVKYSPYRQSTLIDYTAEGDFTTGGTSSVTYGVVGYKWTETNYTGSTTFVKTNGGEFKSMIGIDGANTDVSETYLKIPFNSLTGKYYYDSTNLSSSTIKYKYNLVLPHIMPSVKCYLKVNIKANFITRLSLNKDDEPVLHEVNLGVLQTRLTIGTIKYSSFSKAWVNSTTNEDFNIFFRNVNTSGIAYQLINDDWIETCDYDYPYVNNLLTFKSKDFIIPLPTINPIRPDGVMTFEIHDYRAYQSEDDLNYITHFPYTLQEVETYACRINDISFTIVDSDGNEIKDSDTEYEGYLNKQYKDEGTAIELIQGTNANDYPVERGSLMYYYGGVYSNIKKWIRAGVTDNIENLLPRSLVGNYENKTLELTCTTNILPTIIGYLTYNNYLTGKKFMITSCENNYANATSSITLQEVFVDALTINKTF